MSIYVAIEVLKWFQTGLVFKDTELMKDPANFDPSRAALQESHKDQIKARKERNMVKVINKEVMENLG